MGKIRFTYFSQYATMKILDVAVIAIHPLPQMKQTITVVACAPVPAPKDITLQ